MSTTASIPTLSLSEFAHLVSKRHYHFLSQFLHDLEHRVEQHQAEQHAMELDIMNFQHQIAWRFHFHPYGWTPSHIPPPTNHHDPPSHPSSCNEAQAAWLCECHALVDILTRTGKDQSCRRPFNEPPPSPSYETTDMGSRENPIYVFDDANMCCEEEGHFIGDCNREYQFNGRQYMPIPEGINPMMEQTFVVNRDYYQRSYPRLQAKDGKSTTLMDH